MIMNALLLFLAQTAVSAPQIGFLFNSQIPDVARVGQSYGFILSPSTFHSTGINTTLSLEEGPPWLQINTSSTTLYGKPGSSDVGNATFKIVATDSTGSTSMPASLMVQSGQGPSIGSNISDILAQAGTLNGPSSVLFSPLTSFNIDFGLEFATSGPKLSSYITMRDHTPVPAWMNFDPANFRISGVTPQVTTNSPQRLEMDIIASDTPGFASARVSIVISVSAHKFFFSPVQVIANIPAGTNVNLSTLKSQLKFDGQPITDTGIGMPATAQAPSWLTFNAQDLTLTGTPPPGTGVENITIFAFDKYGDSTSMSLRLNLGFEKLYRGHIGVVNVTTGKEFTYQMLKSDFIGDDLDVQVNMGVVSQWLSFNSEKLLIRGAIPTSVAPQTIQANMTIINAQKGVRDFRQFELQIHSDSTTEPSEGPLKKRMGMIVGIVTGLLLAVLCLLLIVLCCRQNYEFSDDPSGSMKSRRQLRMPFRRRARTQYVWSTGDDEGDTTIVSAMIDAPPKVSLNFSEEKLNSRTGKDNDDTRSFRSRVSRKFSQKLKRNSKSSLLSFESPYVFKFHKAAKALRQHSEEGQVYQRMLQSPIQPQNTNPDDEMDRTTYGDTPSIIQSIDTDILMEDFEDDANGIRIVPPTPPQVFQLPARNHLYTQNRLSQSPEKSSRPLPRRGPYHSSFFAGGSRRRKNPSRIGNVLSTIDGSPESALDEDGNYLPGERQYTKTGNEAISLNKLTRMPTQSTTRDWETLDSERNSPSPTKRLGNQRRWSSLSRDYSQYTLPSRENMVYGQRGSNSNTWYGASTNDCGIVVSGSSSVYSWSPPRGSSSVLDLTHHLDAPAVINALQRKLSDQIPIMERPRAAYRLGDKERSPFNTLSMNERNIPRMSLRESLKVVYGEHGQRLVSVEGRGITSLRGRTSRGSEAFV